MWEKIGLVKTAFGKKTVWDKQILEKKFLEKKNIFWKENVLGKQI